MPREEKRLNFSYSDIIESYAFCDSVMCQEMIRDHRLIWLFSGEYVVEGGRNRVVVGPGQCVFVRRDNRLSMSKRENTKEPFRGVILNFKRNFLREVYQQIGKSNLPFNAPKQKQSVIRLPETPEIKSLFLSLAPYTDSPVEPSPEIMHLKLLEGVYALLRIDPGFYPTLFDFTEPWKIDIIDFMENNYMYDLSVEDMASFTGRSLSSFKRDFKKISDLTPERWLMRRRLEAGRSLLEKGETPSDVYFTIGFKNISHFSAAFKKHFGLSPSDIRAAAY